MQELNVNFENCYGINKLDIKFNFRNSKIKNIYAPNGFMKSSFAKVFIDLSKNRLPKDEIYPQRTTICNVKDENQYELVSDNIFVIESYNDTFKSSKISTLLVNEELKREYDEIYSILEEKNKAIITNLNKKSGVSKIDIEKEILSLQINSAQTILDFFDFIKTDIDAMSSPFIEDVKYSIIFNDKVENFFKDPNMKDNLQEYIDKYNNLIEESEYLQRNFTHNNVSIISNTLTKNGFFSVLNKLKLKKNSGDYIEIATEEELQDLINIEKEQILTNPELKSIFEKIDVALEKNAELRNFRKLIENKPELIVRLNNFRLLKIDLWMSYLKETEGLISELLEFYNTSKNRLKDIIDEAKIQETEWKLVVDQFNNKFNVPFKLRVENQKDVILNNESPSIKFIYHNRGDIKEIDDNKLKSVLSTGEKRALYILNLIFEIEVRKNSGEETLLIIDDIADSFDYKNKYAIIEYLKEILESDVFYMIILTHNFDFFRTVHSRLNINRDDCFMTLKNDSKIKLEKAGYLKNVFNYWKTQINRNKSILIASIPFVRNLIEYTLGEDSQEYKTLTSLLHIKKDRTNPLQDTDSLELNHLQNIFCSILTNQTFNFGNITKIKDVVYLEAERISRLSENNDLENKIAISIAIRLKSEEYMIRVINDDNFLNTIESNQTFELYNEYKRRNPMSSNLKYLAQVNLMTPENIHLNSFMYEPILDMSDRHLIDLFNSIKNL
ncbi:hypothetical protein [Aliarcobacter butzleri]|uniref:hypothetical protein n=2 Tax=Aliarcobacter butzleri TaxID=28197 RepID=UPI001EDBE54F|nr:hypothetical protein [Aliarcobacter butzleri]MCG3677499.1 hypothetical protein [Aliarcobacter butzleri]MCT7591387.1 hypothetical protein [Aliarcobacter butzleri]MCT7593840.1 hypothetical protein [Aliarcobacter butzleri]MCT7598422.1 hypothetical protein [Aliarcobacter butzleri]UWY61220.1 hypothetical protein N3115_05125 [Aliarcobacter butzleri]